MVSAPVRRSNGRSAGRLTGASDQASSDKITLSRERRTRKSLTETADATVRLIRALGRRVGEEHDPEDLEVIIALRAVADEALRIAVEGLRAQGRSDAEIGRALGLTRQAVSQHWPRGAR